MPQKAHTGGYCLFDAAKGVRVSSSNATSSMSALPSWIYVDARREYLREHVNKVSAVLICA